MRYSTLYISLTLLIIFLVGCKKTSKLDTELIPVFTGTMEANVSFKSVSFLAHFEKLDPAEIEDCGFEWIEANQSTVYFVSGGKIINDSFSATAPLELKRDADYEARAWIQVRGKKILSKPVKFSGTVTQKAEILSVNRTYALYGDTIRLKIRNLTSDLLPGDIDVVFRKSLTTPVQAKPYEISFDEIAVIMPPDCPIGALKVDVIIKNQKSINDFFITNAIPQLESVSTTSIHFDDSIVLYGKFWPEYINRVFPVINADIKFDIIKYLSDRIIIKTPIEAACIRSFSISFKILDPYETKSFQFINTGVYLNRYSYYWNDYSIGYLIKRSKEVYLNGNHYFLELNSTISSTKFSKFDDALSTLNSYPAPTNINPGIVVCNNEIYAGFEHGVDPNSNFYKYNIQNDTWTECAKMPVPVEATVYMTTVINNKIYVFVKKTNEKCIYDPISGLWSRSACTVPDFISTAQMFEMNGEYYFYKGLSGDVIYKYNILTNTFSPVIIDGLDKMDNLFKFNNKYYCTAECRVYELNILGETLIEKPEFSNFYYGSSLNGLFYFYTTPSEVKFMTGNNGFLAFSAWE